ncbi:MAG TPA: CHASE2 domain-containing protein, partial [Bacteroidetes bacterium]|nr:CHASE2 domain-containing protein [Bacteroidota bacterium]
GKASLFNELDLKLYDWVFQMRGERSVEGKTEIAIVAIDQHTSDELPFPFDRRYYAEVVRELNGLGARIIAFDIDFSSASDPRSDSVFHAAIGESGNVVLSGKIENVYRRGFRNRIAEPKPPVRQVSPEGTPWGLVNEMNDADNVTRRYPLFLQVGSTVYLSLGVKIYSVLRGFEGETPVFESRGEFVLGDLRVPRFEKQTCLINYYGPAGTFPTYSFIDVISGKYDFDDYLAGTTEEERELLAASGMADIFSESPFKDKIVLIGASDEYLQDNKFTPFFSDSDPRKTPGVEVHANALQMFFDASYIRTVGFNWIVAGVILLSAIIFTIVRRKRQWLAFIGAVALLGLIASVGIWLFVSKGLWLQQVQLMMAVMIGYPVNLVYRFIETQREKAMIRGMFSQYVQKKVTDALIANPDLVKLGGERRRMSVLFTDVAGFTTISEKLQPEELIALLNEYLTEMSQVISDNDGIIDKYEGDLIMAEFGAPIWYEDHAACCCRAALQMQAKLAEMRQRWRSEGRIELYSRVGINTGEMITGNLGSKQLFDYTVMGDAVNISSRLEGANKTYNSTIMIGHETWKDVNRQFITRPLDYLLVKGKSEPVEVFELLAEKSDGVSPVMYRVLELFNQGLEHYRRREFNEALQLFRQSLRVCPEDGPTQVYVKRCELYISQPPSDDWNGVWTLTEK